jgi:hypothetical protein
LRDYWNVLDLLDCCFTVFCWETGLLFALLALLVVPVPILDSCYFESATLGDFLLEVIGLFVVCAAV